MITLPATNITIDRTWRSDEHTWQDALTSFKATFTMDELQRLKKSCEQQALNQTFYDACGQGCAVSLVHGWYTAFEQFSHGGISAVFQAYTYEYVFQNRWGADLGFLELRELSSALVMAFIEDVMSECALS